jgi:uncharacterized membrane protein YedE/YeeE
MAPPGDVFDVGAMVVPFAGGVLIGLAASALLLFSGRVAGISGILGGLLRPRSGDVAWRAAFVVGLFLGAVVLAVADPAALDVRAPGSLGSIALAGVLVGYGTRLGSGCTSGHGVCGVSRLSPRSLLATATFMITGALTVYLVQSGTGGAP